jgi:alkyl sulfatase BDS1-like metallo-beta-lactamase superfamily hydrolase
MLKFGEPPNEATSLRRGTIKRYVELMGGRDTVFKEAQKATKKGDHQWSAELLTHIIRINTKDMDARALKAQNLREIGYTLTNTNWRNWFMTSALELENKFDYSKAINLQAPDVVAVFPTKQIFESLRFRVDGARAAADKVHLVIGATITDEKHEFSMTLRTGVMEFLETKPKNPDIQLSMDRATLISLITLSSGGAKHSPIPSSPRDALRQALEDGTVKVETGTGDDLEKFFSYLDKPSKEKFPITLK